MAYNPITTLDRDVFYESLQMSIQKFFNENTSLDGYGRVFNDTYFSTLARLGIDSDGTDRFTNAEEILAKYSGIISIEFPLPQEFSKETGQRVTAYRYEDDLSLVSPGVNDQIQELTSRVFKTTMQIRLMTNTNEMRQGRTGRAELMRLKSVVERLLDEAQTANTYIPVFNYTNDPETATDVKLQYDISDNTFTDLEKPYNEVQEGVILVPVYCVVYIENFVQWVLTHKAIIEEHL